MVLPARPCSTYAVFTSGHAVRSGRLQLHVLLPVTVCGAELDAHWSSHVASFAHDNEHDPVQWIVQLEPPAQLTLPLSPTVKSHVAWPSHDTLHDLPHVPVHVELLLHASVQLSPAHAELARSHDVCAGHAHDVPLHVGGVGLLEPQATVPSIPSVKNRLRISRCYADRPTDLHVRIMRTAALTASF
jgi:hypothetical protein